MSDRIGIKMPLLKDIAVHCKIPVSVPSPHRVGRGSVIYKARSFVSLVFIKPFNLTTPSGIRDVKKGYGCHTV